MELHRSHDSMKSRVSGIAPFVLSFCWALNLIVIVWLAVWIYRDPLFDDTLHWTLSDLGVKRTGIELESVTSRSDEIGTQKVRLQLLLSVGGFSLLGILIGLVIGPQRFRRISAWLGAVTLMSAWIALVLSHHSLAWSGQQSRARAARGEFESIRLDLIENWPAHDGRRPDLGPFSAYPENRPTLLMRLNQPNEDAPFAFKLIERSEGGGLRFALTGLERGAWLEWHPPGETPESFIGGLGDNYKLTRQAALGDGWYLTRYQLQLSSGRSR